jgi:hypothetical protein
LEFRSTRSTSIFLQSRLVVYSVVGRILAAFVSRETFQHLQVFGAPLSITDEEYYLPE